MLTWILELQVDEIWVEDGFDAKEQEDDLGQRILPHATSDEVKVKVLSAPPEKVIRKLQGYTD